jgi:mono/diheme cytochrome c family protein
MGFDRQILLMLGAAVLLFGADKAGVITLRQPPAPRPAVVMPPPPAAPPVQAAAPAPAAPAAPAAQANPDNETPDALPAGEGREETFHACIACHSTALIRRSGLSRAAWDGLMDWMVEKQNMTPLDPAQRTLIVDYLAQAFPPRRQQPGGRVNPFATN